MAPSRRAFPVGLYGTLLLALCWLLLPEPLRPVERLLLGIACLPQRFVQHAGGQPAMAATRDVAAHLQALRADLERRADAADVAGTRDRMQAGLQPLLCRVREIVPPSVRRGGGGVACELLLDRSYEELAGCADPVTKGDTLLGFLARPGVGPAARDLPTDPARVLLLNDPACRPVAGHLPLPQGGELRCVVQAAAIVDPMPLRTTLHDDPYRAARLSQGDAPVRTLPLDAAWIGAVPGELFLGWSRIWGYDTGEDTLTIGLYVEPPFDPRAVSQVVLWQTVAEVAPPMTPPPLTVARAFALPDGTGGRWLLTARSALAEGAAVVQDGVCLGTVRPVAFGQGLCTSFAASRHPWSLWLLPDDPQAEPVGLYGEVAYADAAVAWFRPRGKRPLPPPGFVFTGSNGRFCPPGLLLGRAEPDEQSHLLRIAVPSRSGAQQVEVVAEVP